MTIKDLNNNDGFTMIELLIAMTILSVGMLAVAQMQVRAMSGNLFAKNVTESTIWAEDKMEELMTMSYVDVVAGSAYTGPVPAGYTILQTITVGSTTSTKLIAITVTPTRGRGRPTTIFGIKPNL
jgi:type IV pilus assembly protein PilV